MIRNSCASEGVGDGRNGFCIEENAAAMAAKLEELCRAPEVMQVVGENAQRELYVSWETAVQRAMARYEVVIDNYRSGKYPKRERFGDEFFKTQGGLMEAFASVGELSEEIAAGLRIERDEALQTIVRSRQELRGRSARQSRSSPNATRRFCKSGPLFMRKRRAKIRSSFLFNLRVLAFPRRTTCSTGRSTPYATPRPRKLDARATAVRAHSRSP